jgi:hypothetical protein
MAASSRDWKVCTPILADHWEPLQHAHPRSQTAYDASLVAQMLACGHPENRGSIAYRCLPWGQGKPRVAMRCQSALGLRCAPVSVDHWVSQVRRGLHVGVSDRHRILTVPAMFRTTLYHTAEVVLHAFMRGGAPCLAECSSTGRGQARQGGSSPGLHTHGRHGPYPPHRHRLATSGG